jgi:hypothetical protein
MQIFIQNEAKQHKRNSFKYLTIYQAKCRIGSAGVIHLAKAEWGRLDSLALGNEFSIKVEIHLWVKA